MLTRKIPVFILVITLTIIASHVKAGCPICGYSGSNVLNYDESRGGGLCANCKTRLNHITFIGKALTVPYTQSEEERLQQGIHHAFQTAMANAQLIPAIHAITGPYGESNIINSNPSWGTIFQEANAMVPNTGHNVLIHYDNDTESVSDEGGWIIIHITQQPNTTDLNYLVLHWNFAEGHYSQQALSEFDATRQYTNSILRDRLNIRSLYF